jgi:hypothetical protein
MIEETLQTNIKQSITNLLKLAEISCWNKISSNLTFILSDYNEFTNTNFHLEKKSRNVINKKKSPQEFEKIIEILKKEYSDLYDISLYVFKAKKEETIIEIQYYRKSNLDKDFFETVRHNPPMLHSKISLPVYVKNKEKFDINWEHRRRFSHIWKTFIYTLKNRKIIE